MPAGVDRPSFLFGGANLALGNSHSIEGVTVNTQRSKQFHLNGSEQALLDREKTAKFPGHEDVDEKIVHEMTSAYLKLVNHRRQRHDSNLTPSPALAARIHEIMGTLFQLFKQGFTASEVLEMVDWDFHPDALLTLVQTAGATYAIW